VDPRVNVGGTRVRWGIGDFFWIYFAGLLASIVFGAIGVGIAGDKPGHTSTLTLVLSAGALYTTWVGAIVFVSRTKGRGSPVADFGLVVRARRAWVLLVGAALQFLLGALVLPLVNLVHNEKQDVVEQLKNAGGAKLVALLVIAGLVAPVCEELLFRGLLLRAFRRRFRVEVAIGASALLFALTHLLGDPSLGVVAILPALFVLGVISGCAAVWVGDLSVSIPLHMGFNLVTLAAYAMLVH
jgi:membrane protease YdiL (CAAX protease family)